ncbi:hypothetical protein [Phytoactinopolyspora halotolerans]|uniref:Uncharacterized protein n=1 Tax=Phytoactinopolyspora halotolerans TaxID=1981512 RepID=A0A6L9SF69_9ACTN|nr:hypothetical protein [Phytoactinopolyspora halotolerans]NEE03122.1 hypothetical protein [Phytoactinopolyspora halotolerans]
MLATAIDGTTAMTMIADRIAGEHPYGAPRHEVLPVDIRTRDASRAHLRPVTTVTQR